MASEGYGVATGEEETGGLKLVNKLAESRSPYVRGHMNNPVAWQMWNQEALALAKDSNRLLFVSIGYAACHWCHVMERESFENPEIAHLLNNFFIPIKIDREERPDVDRIYMNYVQATTGGGGWPLNVFLTPNLEPLFGGTYWPGPDSATSATYGHTGFKEILVKMNDLWQTQQEKCLASAKDITAQLRQFAQEGLISHEGKDKEEDSDTLDLELLEEAYEHFAAKYDEQFKGFGTAPKFPTPVNLRFLLGLGQGPSEVRDVVGEDECAKGERMVLETLKAMADGGIHDQIGNGFARYSVTRDWSLPHFEKMLYDQGQLLSTYLEAYFITKDAAFLEVVHDIATYLTTAPMHSSTGGFFTAEDADSLYRATDKEKREGAFYVWTLKELQSILGDRDAGVLARYYNVGEHGNVEPEHDAHDELIDQNVLAVVSSSDALGKEFGLAKEEVQKILADGRMKLRNHREKERPRPALDDKIVVAWNGLAISALAKTSSVLTVSEPEKAKVYLDAAIKAASFIRKELFDEREGTMKRVYREGPGDAPAFADDYAFLIQGLIELYEATFGDAWLEWADRLTKTQIALFHDTSKMSGGFFSTTATAPDLILRLKDGMDNAEPSTNGVSASNLHRLSSLLNDESYATLAKSTVQAFEAELMQHPFLFVTLLDSVVMGRLGVKGIVVTGEGSEVEEAIRKIRTGAEGNRFRTVVRLGGGGSRHEWLVKRNSLLQSMKLDKPGVMVCEAGVCKETLGVEEVDRALLGQVPSLDEPMVVNSA
ncbi:hypothetical protein FKW77_006599 [Venturia effusa]|uniref:Spermatogenesis-associated protein 20-like TRX domain-containing protein n=1 Tax=Venturia effusa TaxID=50376 RepID=A0A517LN14_9PEZI|nr:hypothetical protein FKW77_006599 [Venturia effusa]